MAIIDANINPPKVFEKETSVKSNKGATAILVGLLAFIAYLYLSGKLTAIGRAISGAPDPLGAATGGGMSGPLQVVPIVGAPGVVPINPSPLPKQEPGVQIRPENFSFTVKHKQTGKPITISAITGFGCTQTVSALLVAGGGYGFMEATNLADRICTDATNRSIAKQQSGNGQSKQQFTVVP